MKNFIILYFIIFFIFSILGLWLCPPVISPSSPNDQFYYYILLNIFSILTESSDSKAITPITDLSRSLLQKLFKVHIIIAVHVVAACKLKGLSRILQAKPVTG